MTIAQIISSGVAGAESAALDVAIRLKIPYAGYTLTSTMLDPRPMHRRYILSEKPFDSARTKDEANLLLADAALIFTHGELGGTLAELDAYAVDQERPCFHVDLSAMEPIQGAFHIRIWTDKHSPESLYVTGSAEAQDNRIYRPVYDTLFSFLMLGRETYPAQEQPAPQKMPLPKTVAEAVRCLVDVLSLKDRVTIANMSAAEIGDLNATLGNYIRNSFGLWAGNEHLMWSCSKEAGRKVDAVDEASAIILGRLALELEKTHKLRGI